MLKIISSKKYNNLKSSEKLANKLSILNYAKTFELDYMAVIIELVKQLGGKATIEEYNMINQNEFIEQRTNPCNRKIELIVKKIEE